MENQEIAHIKQILGLQQGKKYTDVSQLRYGHVMIMADQDHDGSHIKGLIINLFELYWPELLTLKGFLMQFITPIVKVKKGTQELDFFTLPEYETWREETDKSDKWSSKYYKGLGTSSAQQAKGYFSNLDLHAKDFKGITTEDRALVDMAFNKKKADDRKEWLRQFEPGTYMDYYQESISISDFVNKELSLFSMADNHRSLPSMVDGLKPGLRKIVFSCLKKSRRLLRDEHKVFFFFLFSIKKKGKGSQYFKKKKGVSIGGDGLVDVGVPSQRSDDGNVDCWVSPKLRRQQQHQLLAPDRPVRHPLARRQRCG